MKREQIIGILEKYDIDEYHWKNEIADEICALPLDVPSEKEIKAKSFEYSGVLDGDMRIMDIKLWMRTDFRQGAQWAMDEIIKRNK